MRILAPPALRPLRHPYFRAIWIASLFSNFGTWVQSVGAAWLMTSLAPAADMVALVQAAAALPILLFSLTAGAVADIWDRRLVLLAAQGWMLLSAAVLTAITMAGLIGPWLLLALTFSIGMGAALFGPAWQASVGELVPRRELPAAVTLNSVAFNIARSAGPALGGLLVSLAGAGAAFLFNAVSYIAMIIALFVWRRRASIERLPREEITGAIVAGLRYVRQAPAVRTALVRSVAFGFCSAATWALLPLVAKENLGGGPTIYGVLLGAFGLGAVLGALVIGPIRARFGGEVLVSLSTLAFAGTTLVISWQAPFAFLLIALVVGGAAWMAALSSFNITVQTYVPGWVKARALATYQMTVFGGLAFGSWFWGSLAEGFSLGQALFAAGALMLVSPALRLRWRLPGIEEPDLRPSSAWPDPTPVFDLDPATGPVAVTVEYRVPTESACEFVRAMHALRRVRRRDGARRWRLYQDTADPERWVELFTVATWAEHLRQHHRLTVADEAVERRARSFHMGDEPPRVQHLITRDELASAEQPLPFEHR